jgi:hypothetical protein
MKRLNIITQPTAVDDFANFDTDALGNTWELKAERWHARQQRKFRRQLV